jgi:hypothetical protein
METINNIELRDEKRYPDKDILREILGSSYESYEMLLKLFSNNDLSHEWRYYRDGKAWLCKVQLKKRTIVWMSAWRGYMQAAVYFPLRLIDKVYELDIREEVKEKIRLTRDVGKSKPCIFEIREPEILRDFEKVMKLKMESK